MTDAEQKRKDVERNDYLKTLGIKLLRFDNYTVLNNLNGVLQVIFNRTTEQLLKSPKPLFSKGELYWLFVGYQSSVNFFLPSTKVH